ncbi:MAG: redoxin domain-containing protein [Sedimentisphaerales bacterium]
MKRCLILIVAVLVVLAVVGAAFGQEEERTRQRENMRQRFQNMSEAEREKFRAEMQERREKWDSMSEEEREKFRAEMRERFGAGRSGIGREEQLKAIETIEEQVAKLKASIEAISPEDRSRLRELSEEERTKLREKMAKAFRERQTAIGAIEEQLAKLRGPGQPQAGREPSIDELRAIQELAVKEKATQTAGRLERLIARYQRESRVREPEPMPRPERLERPQRERPARQERDIQGESSGKRAPEFELNSFDGKTVSLSDYRGKIVVLEWFNFECPFSRYHYETKNTMVELANKYKGNNVVWFAVNSTNHTTPAANKDFAEKHKLPYPILDDRSGKVGRAYVAETTPHIYIINPRGRIVYEGAIDDSPLGQKKEGMVNYVDNALAELTAGKAVSTVKTKPYGCTVKYAQ